MLILNKSVSIQPYACLLHIPTPVPTWRPGQRAAPIHIRRSCGRRENDIRAVTRADQFKEQ